MTNVKEGLLLALVSICCFSLASSFVTFKHTFAKSGGFQNHDFITLQVSQQDQGSDATPLTESNADFSDIFPDAEIVEFSLEQHKPLGCTVEESLADEQYVFVSKVVKDGYAEQAGIQVGDVLIGLTNYFGDVEGSVGIGIDKVKGWVSSKSSDEVLEIHVARGTEVMSQHEKALVELCSVSSANEKEIEDCVVDYMVSGYEECSVDDEDCSVEDESVNDMIGRMYDMWDEELPEVEKKVEKEIEPKPTGPKVKPWSSRSSPSGTYVRDPATGEMRNIDA